MGVRSKLKGAAQALARPIYRRIRARIEMQMAAADRGEQLLQRHPAAFLDAVSTVAALGSQVRRLQQQVAALQQQVAALQQQNALEVGGDAFQLTFRTDDTSAVEQFLQARLPALQSQATVQLHLRATAAAPDILDAAAAAWLRRHQFTDANISADTASPTLTVFARLAR